MDSDIEHFRKERRRWQFRNFVQVGPMSCIKACQTRAIEFRLGSSLQSVFCPACVDYYILGQTFIYFFSPSMTLAREIPDWPGSSMIP